MKILYRRNYSDLRQNWVDECISKCFQFNFVTRQQMTVQSSKSSLKNFNLDKALRKKKNQSDKLFLNSFL